ncbi:MAG: phytoene desaturase family protein [Rubrobacteraceae bacterium]
MAGGRYDAVVIGSGHNGLVSASYLARAGRKVLVLERRGIIGGATVTEEPWPGYRLSTCSYVCSLLLPEVIRDLELRRYGYHVRPLDPQYFVPFPDGRYLMSFLDGEETKQQIRKFSKKDVEAYDAYWAMWDRIIARVRPLLLGSPPTEEDLAKAFDGPRGEEDRRTITEKSVAAVLDEYFESEEVKAPLCVGGVIGTNAGPRDPGTAYVKLHHILGNVAGYQGAWGFVRGGMGAVAQSLAASAMDSGAEILADAEVAEIEVREGAARGVTLADGRYFESGVILSNADPQRTYLDLVGESRLPEELIEGLRHRRTKGSAFKVLLALGELPDFTAVPGPEVGPQHTGGIVINPGVDYLQGAWEDCERGHPSEKPFMEGYIQSATEAGLAPAGKHTLSLYCQYAPYDTWDGRREEIGANAIETLAGYAPNLPDVIEHAEVLGPPDIEQRIGITGGNIFHGEILPQATFGGRPAPGYPGYRTPVENLYLCGSGTWPGGAVFGAPGRNCARQVLADRGL